jgi:hypothetical protein
MAHSHIDSHYNIAFLQNAPSVFILLKVETIANLLYLMQGTRLRITRQCSS